LTKTIKLVIGNENKCNHKERHEKES